MPRKPVICAWSGCVRHVRSREEADGDVSAQAYCDKHWATIPKEKRAARVKSALRARKLREGLAEEAEARVVMHVDLDTGPLVTKGASAEEINSIRRAFLIDRWVMEQVRTGGGRMTNKAIRESFDTWCLHRYGSGFIRERLGENRDFTTEIVGALEAVGVTWDPKQSLFVGGRIEQALAVALTDTGW